MGNTPQIIKHLLIINIIFFIGTKFSGQISTDFLALHYFENDKFFNTQMFTHMLMHGNEAHLMFKMIGLRMYGTTLANIWGTNKFIFFYLSSGLGAAVIQMLAYYLNIESITATLVENGLSNESIVELFRSGTVNTSVFEYVSKESLARVYNDYNSVMVGASGAIAGVLGMYMIRFPHARVHSVPLRHVAFFRKG